MSDILKNLTTRELAPQRTVSLYKDQEDLIDYLNEKYQVDIKFAKLVREGVDIALKQIKEQLEG